MTSTQAAYQAGCIVSEIDVLFGPLTPGCLNNAAHNLTKLPAHLRHVWQKAMQNPAVADLMADWQVPTERTTVEQEGSFWIGYYHQKVARSLPPDFPTRLRFLREQAGLSVEQLATAAGMTRQAIHNYEAGHRKPTWDAVQKLADALGVPTDTFRDR